MNNPNLQFSVVEVAPDSGTVHDAFFLNQMSGKHKEPAIEYAYFTIYSYTFEVGWKE